MLEHGHEIFVGTTQRVDPEGVVVTVAVVALAPYESRDCEVAVDLRQRPVGVDGR
jgi:hypothetical protein